MKQKLKLSKAELMELLSILKVYYELHMDNETYPQVIVNAMVFKIWHKFIPKLLEQKDKFSLSLRPDEAHTVRYVLITTEFTDPFQLGLSERIKSIQII